jgi:pimeloyl-ACP methyl ester carboxylesterase
MPRTVPVPRGALVVDEPTGSTAPVLAIHGVSSQRRLWDWVRRAAPDLSLVAPDLRGRGDSVAAEGPSSVAGHVEDMVIVLDDLGLGSVHVCGMSMGAFVAVELAHRFPERVRGLVLVDGGPPLPPPPGLTPELVPSAFKDRLGRLAQTWQSVNEYADFFVRETAPLLDPDDPVLLGYLEHDLREGRVRLNGEAVVQDANDIFFGESHWDELAVPTRLLHAEWSVGEGSAPGYSAEDIATHAGRQPSLVATRFVPGVDHAAIIMSDAGAQAVAAELRAALA